MQMPDKAVTEALLRKLEAHVDAAPEFSPSELAALHHMVEAWRGWQSLGKVAKWLIVGLGLVATAATALTSLSGGLKGALKSWLA